MLGAPEAGGLVAHVGDGAAMHLRRQPLRQDYVQDQLGHASLEAAKQCLRLADADRARLRDQVTY